jgi:hypothetical protein
MPVYNPRLFPHNPVAAGAGATTMADIIDKPAPVADAPADPISDARVLGAYKRMLTCQFIGTVGLVGVMVVILLIGYVSPNFSPPLLLLVMLAGMLGAFFSALTRLYQVDQAGVALITPTLQGLGGRYMLMYSTVPPVVGAIAAVVLYMIFLSEIIKSDLFPKLVCSADSECKTISELMNFYWPGSPQDYGKALVWSFVAGFSERFVPDLLQSLVKKQQAGDGGQSAD